MKIKQLYFKQRELKLNRLFLYSALFFAFFSFFGVYKYAIYSMQWFILFFVYEFVFFLGLSSGRFTWNHKARSHNIKCCFEIKSYGAVILWIACILSFLSFAYFIFLYGKIVGAFDFGSYTATSFAERRPAFEKFTLFLMQMGGDAAFLICAADKTGNYKRLKALTHVTLFLPGIRYLLMGTRFTIAVEFLMLFIVKWPILRERINFSRKAKKEMRIIIIIAAVLGIAFLYLFASRSIYYTALEKRAFNIGDMVMKPFWRTLYDATGGKIDFLCSVSDYLGEAPYIFSYFCKFRMPDHIFYGQFTIRSILQIVNNLFRVGKSFTEISGDIAGGQYSGMGYFLIADFGVIGSFIFAFLFGRLFALVEKNKDRIRVCNVILPAIKVMCFFAPIYYFFVGRLDYTVLFCLILSPICLRKKKQE